MSLSRRLGWYSLSSIGAPILSLVTLPLFTIKLGPEQFGSFAVGSALAGLVSALAASVSLVSLPAELTRRVDEERRSYITAVIILALAVAASTSAIVFMILMGVSASFALSTFTASLAVVYLFTGLLNSLWAVCIEILTIEGHAKTYALTTFAQALANAIVIAFALFVLDEIENALPWGFLAAAITGAGGALLTLRRALTLNVTRLWFRRAANGANAGIISALSEHGKLVIERSYLGALVGLAALGLYAHAQYYKGAVMAALNALSRTVLPTALHEAEAVAPQFSSTLRLWTLVQAFVVCAALGFALAGREVISLLTNDKFSDSAAMATALMLILLLQTAAKPHTVLLISRGHGRTCAHLNTLSIGVSIVWLFISVPWIGVWGAVSSLGLQMIVHRIGIYRAANAVHRLGFSDQWIVTGTIAVALCMMISNSADVAIEYRSSLLLACYAVVLWKIRPSLSLLALSKQG